MHAPLLRVAAGGGEGAGRVRASHAPLDRPLRARTCGGGAGAEGGRRQKWVRGAPPPSPAGGCCLSFTSPPLRPPLRKFSLAHKHINKNKNRLIFFWEILLRLPFSRAKDCSFI